MYESVQAQIDTQTACKPYLTLPLPALAVPKHMAFLQRGLEPLSEGYVSLDAARPWLFYWCLNGLALLPGTAHSIASLADRLRESAVACQNESGGFGGGNGQMSHLAPTYAIVLSCAIMGDEACFACIDRRALYRWIMSLKQSNGGFAIQRDGEVDARAAYLALSVASLLNIMTPDMVQGTQAWLSACQRYEGGISGVHHAEAHGGLAFCALAALCLLGDPRRVLRESLDLDSLLSWLTARQGSLEGGFSGRTNKLVDGCYSWWVGAEFALIEHALGIKESVCDRAALARYILSCCQVAKRGGLRDKPEKSADYYHTCYCLAGLSTAQHQYGFDMAHKADAELGWESFCWTCVDTRESWIQESDRLAGIHPIYAIPWGKAEQIRAWSVAQGRM